MAKTVATLTRELIVAYRAANGFTEDENIGVSFLYVGDQPVSTNGSAAVVDDDEAEAEDEYEDDETEAEDDETEAVAEDDDDAWYPTREELEPYDIKQLRDLAKQAGFKPGPRTGKDTLIDMIVGEDEE
jgi:hypothetical protein